MTIIVLTSGTSWTVPGDWTTTNQIETWGGGAGGESFNSTANYGGGGGGGYSSISSLSGLSGSITIQVGAGGKGENATAAASGTATYFNGGSLAASSVGANPGLIGASAGTAGLGGTITGATGTTKNPGGPGGSTTNVHSGAGGGGAGSAGGTGGTGGDGTTGTGGAGGNSPSAGTGGAGGTSTTVPGANASNNSLGGGGGGGGFLTGATGGNGGNGALPGGGGGGGSGDTGSNTGGSGGGGQITITYTPAATSLADSFPWDMQPLASKRRTSPEHFGNYLPQPTAANNFLPGLPWETTARLKYVDTTAPPKLPTITLLTLTEYQPWDVFFRPRTQLEYLSDYVPSPTAANNFLPGSPWEMQPSVARHPQPDRFDNYLPSVTATNAFKASPPWEMVPGKARKQGIPEFQPSYMPQPTAANNFIPGSPWEQSGRARYTPEFGMGFVVATVTILRGINPPWDMMVGVRRRGGGPEHFANYVPQPTAANNFIPYQAFEIHVPRALREMGTPEFLFNFLPTNTIPATPVRFGYPVVPEILADDVEHRRKLASAINSIRKGGLNTVLTVTLQPNQTSTTVTDVRLTPFSFIGFMPLSANAATEIKNGTIYAQASDQQNGSAVIQHAASIQTDRTFNLLIIG